MRKIFLDTDIGGDCDDVAGLALLLQLEREGKCFLSGISSSLACEGSTATARAICKYFGMEKPVGRMLKPVISCDMKNYGKAVKEIFREQDSNTTGVKVFREIFAETQERIDIIAIGPLTTIRDCLQSYGDEISPLSGIELVKEKAGTLYFMGGSFIENYEVAKRDRGSFSGEWNVQQDILATRFVLENYPHDIIVSPYEAGEKVYTKIPKTESPVRFAFDCVAKNMGIDVELFCRNSWDPQTCLFAVEDCSQYFELSEYGKITVDENACTKFTACANGKHRIVLLKDGYQKVEKRINELIQKLELTDMNSRI